ncbi:NB-ARC domain-containing protein [Streptomyces sp. SP17BM10]|uniref:NB-ARC domain-containing protein n=1 Tax=Streptomyces sp. SP17BM10 TaxID=3002530 RepID=UPI002E7754A1|nr:NB-ARC domain-containing protein [Streptomyces sp. SP17BM10]MEE1784476.1 NB-ARC domain-containing protein [Streptomyces sp. SP17BM10]
MKQDERTGAPDPADAADLAEFIRALERLRLWAGGPSLRALAKRVGPLLRPPQPVSHTTVADVFKPDRRRLDPDLVLAVVRALGAGEADAARWRAACTRVHADARACGPVGVLRQLPADLATFTGRERELAWLVRHFASGAAVVSTIDGPAGIGKTQLALHAAHHLVRAGRCADVQLYVDLRGCDPEHPPADPSTVLGMFLRQLEVPAHRVPTVPAERAALFRERMHGKRAVVVLDDAATATQVRDLLPASPTCLVLITSRHELTGLEGVAPHRLGAFTEEEALLLLTRVVGASRVAAEHEAAERIVQACGYAPGAVSAVAARLRSRPAWRLADLDRRLSRPPTGDRPTPAHRAVGMA